MGKLDKGFDFLGYRIVEDKLSIAKTSFSCKVQISPGFMSNKLAMSAWGNI